MGQSLKHLMIFDLEELRIKGEWLRQTREDWSNHQKAEMERIRNGG